MPQPKLEIQSVEALADSYRMLAGLLDAGGVATGLTHASVIGHACELIIEGEFHAAQMALRCAKAATASASQASELAGASAEKYLAAIL